MTEPTVTFDAPDVAALPVPHPVLAVPLDEDDDLLPAADDEGRPLASIRARLAQEIKPKTEAWAVPGRDGMALLFTPASIKSTRVQQLSTLAGKGMKKDETDEGKLAAFIIGEYAECLLEGGFEVLRSDLADGAPDERANFGSVELLDALGVGPVSGAKPSRARGVRALFGDNEPGMIAMSRALMKASGILDDPDVEEAAGPTGGL